MTIWWLPGEDGTVDTGRVTHVTQSARSTKRLPHGSMIGRFHVTELLGRGGAGVVCAAHDPVLDRSVAVKVLQPTLRGPEGARLRARLLCEARAMARLSHPNVVTVFEAATTSDGHLFVMMELVEGGTLRTWLAERKRSWREILDKLCAAGRGLAAAHAAGIVHRDFKLDNVLIGFDGRPRVCDFGIAHWSEAHTAHPAASPELEGDHSEGRERAGHHEVLGTPGYMAPEQYDGGPIDARTDVFGFCAASYRALYDSPPFPTDDPAATIKAVRAGAVRARPERSPVPRWVHRVLVRGLHPDARRRPDLAEILAAFGGRRGAPRWALLAGSLAVVTVVASVYAHKPGAGTRPTTAHVGWVVPALDAAPSSFGPAVVSSQETIRADSLPASASDAGSARADPLRGPVPPPIHTLPRSSAAGRPPPPPPAQTKQIDRSAVL
jgi:serine/threonine protein kinase